MWTNRFIVPWACNARHPLFFMVPPDSFWKNRRYMAWKRNVRYFWSIRVQTEHNLEIYDWIQTYNLASSRGHGRCLICIRPLVLGNIKKYHFHGRNLSFRDSCNLDKENRLKKFFGYWGQKLTWGRRVKQQFLSATIPIYIAPHPSFRAKFHSGESNRRFAKSCSAWKWDSGISRKRT